MVEGITWTVQFQENVFDDIYNLLIGLQREGRQTKGYLKSFLRGSSAARRDNVVYILEDVDFLDSVSKGNTTLYEINENGQKYLEAVNDPDLNEKKIFHSSLYRHILHYWYAYDFLLENEIYQFTKEEFIENLVKNSSKDYGTRIYDWKSGENVLDFMKSLEVLSKIKKEYSLNNEYRKIFNESELIRLIEELLKDDSMFTKTLCEELVDKSDIFMASKEPVSIENIYKKLLRANKEHEFLKFIPGLSRPPIPANNTLVELKGVY